MSVENLKEYARRCATEEDLRMRAKEIGMSDVDAHIREASALGLEWSMDDMVAFRKEMVDADGYVDHLDEEELEQVAGGIVTATVAVVAGGVAAGAVGAGATAAAVTGGTQATGDGGW